MWLILRSSKNNDLHNCFTWCSIENVQSKYTPRFLALSANEIFSPSIQIWSQSEDSTYFLGPHNRISVFSVSYRVFNCILVHFIPLPVFIFYSFTGIYILLILFLYSILSTLFPCTLYGLIFPFLFLYFYSIFVYSFSLFSVPAWMGLYRRGWDYTAWSVFVWEYVFVQMSCLYLVYASV